MAENKNTEQQTLTAPATRGCQLIHEESGTVVHPETDSTMVKHGGGTLDAELENVHKRIGDERSARVADKRELQGNIDTEKNAREAADKKAQEDIAGERNARVADKKELQGNIDTEKNAREAADKKAQEDIAGERNARVADKKELQGKIEQNGTAIQKEESARQKADNLRVLLTVYENDMKELKERLIWAEMGNPPRWFRESLVAYYDIERQGSSNEEMLALRKAGKAELITDFSPNRLDLNARNFVWGGMSGFGGYKFPFNKWKIQAPDEVKVLTNTKIMISTVATRTRSLLYLNPDKKGFTSKYKIEGLREGDILSFGNGSGQETALTVTKDGIYTVDWEPIKDFPKAIKKSNEGIWDNVFVEIIPEYPHSLVFDGEDDFLVNTNMPIIDKNKGFTLFFDVNIIEPTTIGGIISKNLSVSEGAFRVSQYDQTSFGGSTSVKSTLTEGINIMTPYSLNGKKINPGNGLDVSTMWIGCLRENTKFSKMVFRKMLLINKVLTSEQQQWVKDHYFPATPDMSMHERTQLDYAVLEAQQNKK